MIRVGIVDDHPAVRLGLKSAVQSEPGMVPVGTAASVAELPALLYRSRPAVLLLDYNLPDGDGLTTCHEIKSQPLAPAIILYSAFADDAMTVPAIVAGADGVLDKSVPPRELFEAIREVNRGGSALPAVTGEHLAQVRGALQERDLPIVGMLLNRTPVSEIAATLQLAPAELHWRMGRMLKELLAAVGPATRQPGPAVPLKRRG